MRLLLAGCLLLMSSGIRPVEFHLKGVGCGAEKVEMMKREEDEFPICERIERVS